MRVKYIILVVFTLASQFKCENETTTEGTTEIIDNGTTITTTTAEVTTMAEERDLNYGIRGLYGGTYFNKNAFNPENVHYIHGIYQKVTRNYYKDKAYHNEDSKNTLDYYLDFGLSRMTDSNFQYEDFQQYDHDINRTIEENETIPSNVVIGCHPNATFLCPENTEAVCLYNGTIYCMSKISVVLPCDHNETIGCVNTTVPCVNQCQENFDYLEVLSLPCLANVVIVDVYEDNKGKTLSAVGGTFVIVDALEEKERTFCVTVIVDPKRK